MAQLPDAVEGALEVPDLFGREIDVAGDGMRRDRSAKPVL